MQDLRPRAPRAWIAAIDAAIALALLAGAGAGTARAQSGEAEALFEQGNRLMAEAKLVEACDAFDASRRIEPRAGTLIRLAECREANHQLASAWVAYKDALARAKDPRKRDIAGAKARQLEPRLSHLTIEVADDVRVDGLVISRSASAVDPALWNRSVPIDGGEFVIAARAPGHAEWRTSITVPEAGGAITVQVPRLVDVALHIPAAAPVPVPVPASIIAFARPPPREPARSRWTTTRRLAIGAAGAGIAAVAIGALLGASASSLEHDAFHACPDPATPCDRAAAAQATLDRGHRRAIYADIGFGIGAAATIAAAALWFVGAPRTEPALAVAPVVAPAAAGLALSGRF